MPVDHLDCHCVFLLSSDTLHLADWHKAAESHDKASNGGTAGNGALMRAVYGSTLPAGSIFRTSSIICSAVSFASFALIVGVWTMEQAGERAEPKDRPAVPPERGRNPAGRRKHAGDPAA